MPAENTPQDAPPPQFSGRQIVRVRDAIVCAAEIDVIVSDAEWHEHPPVGIERDSSRMPSLRSTWEKGSR